jgi:DNA-binding NarL/FixJ family response regulator
MTIRVLLVEDHDLVRAGVRALIAGLADIEVVGEAATGQAGLELAEQVLADVVLLDLSLPELHGLEVLQRLQERRPELRVLVLSMHRDEEYAARAIRQGAYGYLTKDASADELGQAIRDVHRGVRHVGSALSLPAVHEALRRDTPDRLAVLTPRQREVLQLVAEGHTTREVAARLGISPKTVEVHRSHLMDRLEIRELAGLVRFAIATGLVSSD